MQYYQEAVALGSKTGLSLVSDLPTNKIDALYRDLWRAIFLFERRFSRFIPASELSQFNQNTGLKRSISPEFHDILIAAQQMSYKTDGFYNPFILPAVQLAGYVNSRVPGHEKEIVDDHTNKTVASIDRLEVADNWARIPYGTAIDLGGCGKGYLADQLRDQIPNTIDGYWLSFGGDIVVGGHDENDQLWKISIESATDSNLNAATFTARESCGIATSGTTIHRGRKAGKLWHHLIDPRTLLPARTDVLLATVSHKSALHADIFASCAVILGSEHGLKFLKSKGVTASLLQYTTNNKETAIVHFGRDVIINAMYA